MSNNVSFQKIPKPAQAGLIEVPSQVVSEGVPANQALAPIQPYALATPAPRPMFLEDNDENIDFSDVIFPKLNIVAKTGDLSNVFVPGSVVLDRQLVLLDAPPAAANAQAAQTQPGALRFVVVCFRPKQYQEKVEGGIGGNVLDTPEQVHNAGGTILWSEAQNTGKPLYQVKATALVILERPEAAKNDNTHFLYEVEGKSYGVALWSLKASSYTNAAMPIFTARKRGHLKSGFLRTRKVEPETGGFLTGVWTLQSKLENRNGNFYFIPVVKPSIVDGLTEETSLEFRKFARDLVDGPAQ